ncbi:MAG TPA: M23 family metallopeptidase [Croceibacterium sp.]|nr:M23 family metallopeptidase [Croceibacterium sp.]
MSRLGFLDRLQTIAATATVTSAVWIVVGTVVLGRDGAVPAAPPAETARSAPRVLAAAGQAPLPDTSLTIPVVGVAAADLVDSFADARGGRRHEAIDIMAPAGTPVVAAAPGTVEKLFLSNDGGNTIYVRSGDRRTIYYYAHLLEYAPGLAEGQSVQRGQRLGAVGSTGNADQAAPHLHFAVLQTTPSARWWDSSTAVDPYPLLVAK